jgi:hypothetical protein
MTRDGTAQHQQPRGGSRGASPDLSKDIAEAVRREPGDRVQCVRVFRDYYRCNWWSPLPVERGHAAPSWSALTTRHVRQSHFLLVTRRDDTLDIGDVAPAGRRAVG